MTARSVLLFSEDARAAEALRDAGYSVVTVASAKDVAQRAADHDVIVLDCDHPDAKAAVDSPADLSRAAIVYLVGSAYDGDLPRTHAPIACLAKGASSAALRCALDIVVAEKASALELRERNGRVIADLKTVTYALGHDLRAPLRGIDGFAKAIIEDYGPCLDPEALGYLERISGTTRRLSHVIDELTRLSRVSSTTNRRAPVDLATLARIAVLEHQAAAAEPRVVDVVIADTILVDGSEDLLRMAIESLVSNAWKFTATKPAARIEVGAVDMQGERVVFVRDNGVGFEARYAGKLFEPFHRLHAPHEFPGLGLGLMIARRVVEHHGGRIWAESTAGEGATFFFALGASRVKD